MDITLPEDERKGSPIFSSLKVRDTMRRHTITLGAAKDIETAIRTLIKHKIDSLLVIDNDGLAAGVVTKTEIMGAYYAAMPLATPLSDIMGTPVIQCGQDDSLESALVTMQHHAIHRLYVTDGSERTVGVLSYPDIVGTLYRYCCNCNFSLRQRQENKDGAKLRYAVKDLMTTAVVTVAENDSIQKAIEKLSSFRLGALLVLTAAEKPAGVISKTDLVLAYKRAVPLEEITAKILNKPVISCCEETSLEEGIRQMIFSEVGRLFIYTESADHITGVLSLTDTARIRSGSCQACSSSKIQVKKDL